MVQSSTWIQRSSLADRSFRLIDRFCEPHPQLDGSYLSIDEALADAIRESLDKRGLSGGIEQKREPLAVNYL